MPEIQTVITSVSVYPDRARVTRSGEVSLEPGSQAVEIGELPLGIDPDSVRASARGMAHVRLLGVQMKRDYLLETPVEEIHALEIQYESLLDDQRSIDLKLDALKGSRSDLAALAAQTQTYAMALASGDMTLEKGLDFYRGIRQGIEDLDREQQGLLAGKRELERRITKARNELEQQRTTLPLERNRAIVEVEVLQPGSLTVELSYVISGARWKPIYDLRLQETGSAPELEVGYLAQVTQYTGETWQEVLLTLSTARPALAGIQPELDPWFIQPLPPPPPVSPQPVIMAARQASAMHKMRLGDMETQGAALEEQPALMMAEEALARVSTSGAALTYLVPGCVTIPPDGTAHKVTVARFPLQPRLDYVAAPKIAEAAYRRARVTNDTPYTLLAGQANLFIGDEFIGAAQIELTAPQGEVELYLGVDDRLKLERQLKRRDVDKRLIGSRRRIVFGYEIRLENLLPSPAIVTLHDQAPVSRHEDIKVKLETIDPRPTEQTDLNLLKWELTLASKEKRTVRFEFSVEYPQAMQVTGLP